MVKLLTLLAVVGICATGCRVVETSSQVTNTFTAGNDVVLNNSGTNGSQEGTQAADKDYKDSFSPKTDAKVTPGL